MLIFCSTFSQIGFYGDRYLIWIRPTNYSWAVLGCNALLLSPRLRDATFHPSFLWKAHSVPVSLFYFSHPHPKGLGKIWRLCSWSQLLKIAAPKAESVTHLKLTCCFLQKIKGFLFLFVVVGCLLYIDCLLWSWVPLSFRAVAIFQDMQPKSCARFPQLVL